jgi:hypothetical protein
VTDTMVSPPRLPIGVPTRPRFTGSLAPLEAEAELDPDLEVADGPSSLTCPRISVTWNHSRLRTLWLAAETALRMASSTESLDDP